MAATGEAITDPDAIALLERLTAHGQRIVLVRNRERETVYVSDNAVSVSGWTVHEFAQQLYSIVDEEDLPALLAASRSIRSGAREQRVAVRTRRVDGRPVEYDVQLLNHFDDPAIDGIVAVLTPLAPIVDESNRWTALLALTSEFLLIQRGDDQSADFVSPSCEALLGTPPDELLRTWPANIHPDDLGTLIEIRDSVLARSGSEARCRLRVRHADGRWLTLDATFANHVDDALIGGLLIRARDVSELVATEARLAAQASRFEAIVTKGPGATVLLDADAVVTFCSDGIRTILGFEPDDLVGRTGLELVHPDDLAQARAQVAELLAGVTTLDPTLRLAHADGHYEWVGITAVNQLDHPELGAIVLSLRNRGDEMLAEDRIRRLLRDASGATFVIGPGDEVTWATPGVERFIGEHRVLGAAAVDELVAAPDVDRVTAGYREVVRGGHGTTRRFLCRIGPHTDKAWVDIALTNAIADPTVRGSIVNLHEVDDAVRAGETGNRLTEVLQNTTDFVSIFDGELNLLWRNAAASTVFGPAPAAVDEVLTQIPRATRIRVLEEVMPALDESGSWRGELDLLLPRGTTAPVEVTILAHDSASGDRFFSMMGRDITDRKRLESRLEARARHDQLTGLPNRLFLSERLAETLESGRSLALIFIDLDQFKAVNDSQGHDAGDRLLVTASERLRHALRPTDLVARFGGDEFVVLLPGIDAIDDALPLAERVLEHLRGPVQLGAIPVYLTGSAGIAISDGSDATTLISNADAAMYKAKSDGRDRVAVFTAELRDQSRQRLQTAHTLRSALDADELEVWYQPVVESPAGRPIGVEALVRWSGTTLGAIRTAHLIEVAEATGMILPLGAAVIDKTCAAIAALDDGDQTLTFSVNLSAHQLADPMLIDSLEGALTTHGVDPRRLFCEVTESAVMVDVTESAQVLDRIRDLGVGIAIDDFGTGYSSLAYLQRFPVDVLKIDREFITGLTMDSDWKRSLAAAIISLGHSLGLQVVAEGVEEPEQATVLEMLGCDAMQGYLYAQAVSLDELPAVLNRLREGRRARD